MGEAMVAVAEDMVEVAALVDTVGAVPVVVREAMEEEIATVVMAAVAAEGVEADMVVEGILEEIVVAEAVEVVAEEEEVVVVDVVGVAETEIGFALIQDVGT